MSAPQFDSNAWYSLQNVGQSAYLGCNSISICGADGSDLTTFERFQVNAFDGGSSYFIRPESRDVDESGQPFCINLSTGQPFLSLCNDESAIWGMGYWNGADASEGLYLFDTQKGDSQRLYLSDNGVWSLVDYSSQPSASQDSMRWATSSLAAINNQTYSTVPAPIASGGSAMTTATMSPTDTGSSSMSTSIGAPLGSTPSHSMTASSTSNEATTAPAASTSTVTGTVIASTAPGPVVLTTTAAMNGTSWSSTSPSSSHSPTISQSTGSGVRKVIPNARALTALALMVAAPQLLTLLS